MGVIDLNCKNVTRIMEFSGISGVNHACWQTRILSSDGPPSYARFSPLRSALPWRPARQKLSMSVRPAKPLFPLSLATPTQGGVLLVLPNHLFEVGRDDLQFAIR